MDTQIISAIVEEGCAIEGRMSFTGTAKISGQFTGEIFSRDELIITESASVKADVEVGSAIIKGSFEGNITAFSKVTMLPPAHFRGTVTAASLKIEEGVVFEGASYIPKN